MRMKGQITLNDYLNTRNRMFPSCSQCICKKCLFWWSSRCQYGECYDDKRTVEEPYDKAHPNEPPRTGWSNWKHQGEQAHWCRGGIFYPVSYCERFIKYAGSVVEDCVTAPVQIFQDGYTSCTLKESIGCDACIAGNEGRKINEFSCEHMTDTGCERMITAKNLILDEIIAGEDLEPCREQCCIGCKRSCGYRCGQKK